MQPKSVRYYHLQRYNVLLMQYLTLSCLAVAWLVRFSCVSFVQKKNKLLLDVLISVEVLLETN